MSLNDTHISPVEDAATFVEDKKDAYPSHHEKVDYNAFKEDAMRAEEEEKSMTLWQNLKTYKKAVFWSFAISLNIIMEGFDLNMTGGLVGIEPYRRKYGFYGGEEAGYQLTPAWQSAIGQASTIGNIFGIFLASYTQDKYGYRRTIQISLVSLCCFVFITFFAPRIEVLFIGQLLSGLPFGALSSSCVAYASDITPTGLRGYLTSYVNLCWVMGQFISAGCLVKVNTLTDQWAYRIPFACQWIWPIPLFILVTLAPESPWVLIRQEKYDQAEKVISRIKASTDNVSPADTVAMMRRTNDLELANKIEGTYWDCFKGVDLRRTEIVVMSWSAQIFAGSSFANQPTYFFQQAGLTSEQSFQLGLGTTALAFVGTCLSWIILTKFGRRPVFIVGTGILTAFLFIVGGVAFPAETNDNAKWVQATFIMLWVLVFDLTIGPMAYTVVGETSSTRLRAKTIGLSRSFYNITGIWVNTLVTYQINPTAWNWKGKASLFWAGTAAAVFIWSYFRLPECKGRTYRELDILFERRIPANKFKETVIREDEDE